MKRQRAIEPAIAIASHTQDKTTDAISVYEELSKVQQTSLFAGHWGSEAVAETVIDIAGAMARRLARGGAISAATISAYDTPNRCALHDRIVPASPAALSFVRLSAATSGALAEAGTLRRAPLAADAPPPLIAARAAASARAAEDARAAAVAAALAAAETPAASSPAAAQARHVFASFVRQAEALEFLDSAMRARVASIATVKVGFDGDGVVGSRTCGCGPSRLPKLKLFSLETRGFATSSVAAAAAAAAAAAGSDVPILEAQRTPAPSSRRFIVADVAAFWRVYADTAPAHRHGYEIVRADTPCRLFLDLEFRRGGGINNGVDGGVLMAVLLHRLSRALRADFGLLMRAEDALVLESSSASKFSRHVIVHARGEALVETSGEARCGELLPAFFRDVEHAGRWVKRFMRLLEAERANDAAVDALWVESDGGGGRGGSVVGEVAPPRVPFVDLGVYTRNRAFRLMFSSKLGKGVALLPSASSAFAVAPAPAGDESRCGYWLAREGSAAAASESLSATPATTPAPAAGDPAVLVGPPAWERELFADAFITATMPPLPLALELLGAPSANLTSSASRAGSEPGMPFVEYCEPLRALLLHCDAASTMSLPSQPAVGGLALAPVPPAATAMVAAKSPSSCGAQATEASHSRWQTPSPGPPPAAFTRLCDFIRCAAGGPAETAVARWERSAGDSAPPSRTAGVRAWAARLRALGCGAEVVDRFALDVGARFCNRIGRPHKSNGVRWTADLVSGAAWQTCHDADCRDYRSPSVRLPLEVLPHQLDAAPAPSP